ncbi:MAG TPA: 1,2-phenylacetyl-CoA epoxidase subunit PaaC, partial [Chitinophagaceae bacterium]
QDIAITNISLDLIGQARNFFQYAALLYNIATDAEKKEMDPLVPRLWKDYSRELQEDDLAFLRDENQYLNLLITELPKGDWAYTVLKQFFFSAYQHLLFEQLQESSDAQLSAIAEKSIKETAYHLRWSSEWVVRLGDGTEESNRRINNALQELWMFTGEMFTTEDYDLIKNDALKQRWLDKVSSVFQQATLTVPSTTWMQSGGKQGRHTEYLGYLLAEMQHLQRTYPNATW